MSTLGTLKQPRSSGGARWLGVLMLAASALLAGCVTGYPGTGGYPGSSYPGDSYPGDYGSQPLLGTVQEIDLNNGRLRMTADRDGYDPGGYDPRYGGTSQVELGFDRNTQLVYQGRVQSVEGLERGDRISVDAQQSQGRLYARRIEVVQNVRDTPGGGYYGGELRGAVNYVDPRARLITLTRGGYSGSREQVYYDERTQVEYRGQWFRPEQLDPGDVVRVQVRPQGNGWLAERIWVEVDARSR
ncbi:DUF5666 domain-containing protein [Lysobacter koreensis]|uniref:DUF5666 domain-containing protein n=1 Tax=Lysobacter koreensis TaxID=266122 RepID=A0ABW2YNL3_9GAMM